MKIAELVAGMTCELVGDPETPVSTIEHDSRLATAGSLFVALAGGYTDGHLFLRDAVRRGATTALVERGRDGDLTMFAAAAIVADTRAALAEVACRFYGDPSRSMTVVGVTGTDGKTTTCHFIEALCRSAGHKTGLIGTVSVRIGADEDLHASRQTTPESLLVQRYLAEMRDAGVDLAVIEATSHGLELHRLDNCLFDVGVVTNVTHEHLDFHGTVENYRRAKGGLLRRVAAARPAGKRGVAIVNADDPGALSLVPDAGGCDVIRFTTLNAPEATVRARAIVARPGGSSFRIALPDGEFDASINLPGAYNVSNATAAAAVGVALGLDGGTIAAGLGALDAVPGRMEAIDEGQPFTVIVDYAHTPDAIRSVLREARRLGSGRTLVLFGSAGERDVAKRAIQGAVAVTDADFAVFTSEDPRFEDPDAIIAAIAAGATQAGGRAGVDFICVEDRAAAIAALLDRAKAGDVVVLAGKGHERSMIYGDEKRPWHEANAARRALNDLGFRRPTLNQVAGS